MEELLVTAVGYLKLAVGAVGAMIVGLGALSTAAIYVLSLLGIMKRSNSAIVEIRTVLNYFLSKEIERERQEVESTRRGQVAMQPDYRAGQG